MTSSFDPWHSPPQPPTLQPGEVHIWRLHLPGILPHLALADSLLSPAEKLRASAIRHLNSRHQFVAGRLALRTLLAHYLQRPPQALDIRLGLHNKPTLAIPGSMAFNLAHAAETLLIALTLTGPIGIDVESQSPATPLLEIARESLTPEELATFLALPKPAQTQAFLRIWTRKEALTKADGRGLGIPGNTFAVPFTSAQNAPVTLPKTSLPLYVSDLPLPNNLAAAIAISLPKPKLHLLTFPPRYLERPPKLSTMS